jgi:hypothetical protein
MAKKRPKKDMRQRGKVMEMVRRKHKTLKDAAVELGIGYRQAERIYRKYLAGGDEALVHGNSGRPSNHKTDGALTAKAIALYKEKYYDYGPTLAAETMLERDGLEIGVSTLRRVLIAGGLWTKAKNSVKHRSRRAPREKFGELVQFDGSHHKWFEGRGPKCCLITLIDDATKTRLGQFFDEETMFGTMTVLKMWIETYGIPDELYCDKKNAFVLTRDPTDSEIMKGITKPKSHFGRACAKLGVNVIAANSAQAKGRVERNHGVDQDRLVKAMRLDNISTIEEANKYLLETYLPKMNAKFGRPAQSGMDAHVKPGRVDLDDIFCMEEERNVSKDFVIRFQARLFQIKKDNKIRPRPNDKVIVRTHMDSSIHIIWKDKPLLVEEISTMFDD